MTFLAPLPGLHFLEEQHRYFLDGFGYLAHSVTGVVSDLSPQARKQIDATRHEWEPRGVAAHAALEGFLLGEAVPSGGDYAEIVNPLLAHPIWKDCEVIACEYRLCDTHKSLAGSFDALIKTQKGKTVLLDLKTVGKQQAIDARKPATAQLGGYLAMLNNHHPTLLVDSCVTVVAGPGRTRIVPADPDDCISSWLDSWGRFQLLQPDF